MDTSDYNADWAREQDRMREYDPRYPHCHTQPCANGCGVKIWGVSAFLKPGKLCSFCEKKQREQQPTLDEQLPWLASQPPLPSLPTTVLRHCANEQCCSQGGRRALISRESGHDLCTVCQKQAKCRAMAFAEAGDKYSDWPTGTAPVSHIQMQTRREFLSRYRGDPLPPAA